MVRASASDFLGEYYSHGKQFLDCLPIPELDSATDADRTLHDEIDHIAQTLVGYEERVARGEVSDAGVEAILVSRAELIRRLDRAVARAYGLGEDDLDRIRSEGLSLRRPVLG